MRRSAYSENWIILAVPVLILVSVGLIVATAITCGVRAVSPGGYERVKVNDVVMVYKNEGMMDGISIVTSYMVLTDKGTYEIATRGIFARPEVAGMMKRDSTYTIKWVGWNLPLIGNYRKIIGLKDGEGR